MAGVQASREAPTTTSAAAVTPPPLPPTAGGAGGKKAKKPNGQLVGAGTPSEDFIAGAETRSLERQPYW